MSDQEQTLPQDSIEDAVAKLVALDQPESEDQTENPTEEVEQDVVEETTDEEVVDEQAEEATEETEEAVEAEPESEDSESEFITEGFIEVENERVSIEEAKLGYLRQSDYTKKTQALAEQRKQVDDKGQAYESTLNALLSAAGADLGRFDGVNWEQAAIENPEQYQQAKAVYNQTKQTHDFIQSQVTAHKEKQQTDLQTKARESLTLLKNTIPNWNNDLYYSIGEYANKSLGVSSDEYNEIADSRLIVALHKAMQFDRAKAETTKKVKASGKKTLSSKKAEPKDLGRKESFRKAKQRLRDTGSMNDAVDALLNLG